MSDRRRALLLDLLDQAFDRRAWHGTGLWGSLRGLTYREALWRPRVGRHNIWEIVLHAAYWKYIVRRRLLRDPALAFPRAGSNWLRLPEPSDAAAWRRDVTLLKEQHRLLRAIVEGFPATRLGAKGWRSTWTNVQHVYGIASHDLYHAGQIQLLKVIRRQSSEGR
ncbi:MAG TPA: DinB family protein [Gemmatimonadales bacterium]|nr:DinB family protein [Gemmatimonadales bacterium]